MSHGVRYVYFSERDYENVIEVSINCKGFKFSCKIPIRFLVELKRFCKFTKVLAVSHVLFMKILRFNVGVRGLLERDVDQSIQKIEFVNLKLEIVEFIHELHDLCKLKSGEIIKKLLEYLKE